MLHAANDAEGDATKDKFLVQTIVVDPAQTLTTEQIAELVCN
jgi:hypothetical protein